MLPHLTETIINDTLNKAKASPRKRAIYSFHTPEDTLQRMINAGFSDTYARPHKHEDPDKLEMFCIIEGKVAILSFHDNGEIQDCVIIDSTTDIRIVEIPPRTWHSIVILSEKAVLYEIIEGKYDAATHKKFAPWSPDEADAGATENYVTDLKVKIKKLSVE